MGKIFTLNGENMTLGTGYVLAALSSNSGVAAGSLLGIRRIEIGQSGSVTLAQIRGALSIRTGSTLTMTAATPKPLQPVGGVASGIVGNATPSGAVARSGVNSSVDTTPTYDDHYQFNFCNINGWLYVPTPEEIIRVPPSTVWCVRFLAAPTVLTGWSIAVTFEELA